MRFNFWVKLVCVISIFPACSAYSEILDIDKEAVKEFVELIKNNKRDVLSKSVHYPIKRLHPLPPVKNEKEFLAQYDEIFDASLIDEISKSNLELDWDSVGAKGIMFKSGSVWLDLDGSLLAVNYVSKLEKKRAIELDGLIKDNSHDSVKKFVNSVLEWRAGKFHIRIDKLEKGGYRYAVWPANSSTISKPDLVIENGEKAYYGSGGSYSYEFKAGKYKYVCAIYHARGEGTPPRELLVYKEDELLLREQNIDVIRE